MTSIPVQARACNNAKCAYSVLLASIAAMGTMQSVRLGLAGT